MQRGGQVVLGRGRGIGKTPEGKNGRMSPHREKVFIGGGGQKKRLW